MIEHRKNATHKKFESSFSKWSRRFFKHFLSSPWFSNNKNQSSFDDIIFPALLFFSGASMVLWEEAVNEKDPSNKLRLIALIYGLQIFSFLLLRPILRSILRIGLSFSFLKYILFAVFTSITFLISFEEFWSLTFFGGILTFAVALFLSAESSFVIFKQKLGFRPHFFSLIPLSLGFIFFGNVLANLFLNGNLNYLSYLVYDIILIFIFKKYRRTQDLKPDKSPDDLQINPLADIISKQSAPRDTLFLRDRDLANLESRLESFIKEKLFLKPNLSQGDLADYLGLSRYETSRYLNLYKRVSFYDLINKLRIQEAQKLIAENISNLTQIASLTGFGSYATFFKAYLKFAGSIPKNALDERKRDRFES
ncbi:DNA-binding helix-turn-helix protein [Leptospira alstonii serovar Sichuan str. 79601]|uniref:DNA-binding helix-turn-helix protein n=1 Tax=Leptospira alstonii serovar Sichuan str. 79601 TaxID=1218565 RepID=M6DA70_9LEPT|nr:DNA-binding helix-turn-helix protein [Leptospira alstonii serovar Sichuan str. 79601]